MELIESMSEFMIKMVGTTNLHKAQQVVKSKNFGHEM